MKAVFITGNEEIIHSKANKHHTKTMYDFILKCLQNCGIEVSVLPSNLSGELQEYISPDIDLLIGHSKGASWIASRYDPLIFPHIQHIILFDPMKEYCKHWNTIHISKVLFVSSYQDTTPYTSLENVVFTHDPSHYFLDSFAVLQENIWKIVRSKEEGIV